MLRTFGLTTLVWLAIGVVLYWPLVIISYRQNSIDTGWSSLRATYMQWWRLNGWRHCVAAITTLIVCWPLGIWELVAE